MNSDKDNGFFCEQIASMARESLILEVETTPKPGLVDKNNNGAHIDMNLQTFLDSADALYPYFKECAKIGSHPDSRPQTLLSRLRPLGIHAEQIMYHTTHGVNTHKGAIFSMGIFCGAAGLLWKESLACPHDLTQLSAVCQIMCNDILCDFREDSPQPLSHGENMYHKYHLTGVRGEAAAGFPSVFRFGYPIYMNYKKEALSTMEAGACTLLHLISRIMDTNIAARTDYATLLRIQKELTIFLSHASAADILQALPAIDTAFIQRNISPGGCADILALIYFLDMPDSLP